MGTTVQPDTSTVTPLNRVFPYLLTWTIAPAQRGYAELVERKEFCLFSARDENGDVIRNATYPGHLFDNCDQIGYEVTEAGVTYRFEGAYDLREVGENGTALFDLDMRQLVTVKTASGVEGTLFVFAVEKCRTDIDEARETAIYVDVPMGSLILTVGTHLDGRVTGNLEFSRENDQRDDETGAEWATRITAEVQAAADAADPYLAQLRANVEERRAIAGDVLL